MKNFMVIYHAPLEAWESTSNDPEDMKKGMEEWMTWAKSCGDKLVDFGQPLVGGQKLKPDGGSDSSNREVCGYSILQAENMDEAKSLLKNHPHLKWTAECEIEVHETMPPPGT